MSQTDNLERSEKWLRRQDTLFEKWRIRTNDANDRKAFENVFDTATLKTLYRMADRGSLSILDGVIAIGKEANVFRAERHAGTKREQVAVKIYRTTTGNFKAIEKYITGDPRFRNVRTGDKLVHIWAKKEFANLAKLHEAGIRVPAPVDYQNNVLIMRFIGSSAGVSAPQVRTAPPEDAEDFAKKLIKEMRLMYRKAQLVHGDLSEYNILNFRQKPVIIDVGQAVLLKHPHAQEFLTRDAKNVARFLSALGAPRDAGELRDEITS